VHQLAAAVTDEAGNLGPLSAARTVTIDTRAPVLTLDEPTVGGMVQPGARFRGTLAGTGSAPEEISHHLDNGRETAGVVHVLTGAFDEALDLEGVAPGTHRLTVTGTDLAGNAAQVSINLVVDVPFTLTEVTPPDGAVDVGVTFRPQIFFSKPVDPASLND